MNIIISFCKAIDLYFNPNFNYDVINKSWLIGD